MEKQIDQLSDLKKAIIRDRLLDQPDKPCGFGGQGGQHCLNLSTLKYDHNELSSALEELAFLQYFTKNSDGSYIFPVDVHRYVRKYYLKRIILMKVSRKLKEVLFSRFFIGLLSGSILVLIGIFLKNKFG